MTLIKSIESRLVPSGWRRATNVRLMRSAMRKACPLNVVIGAGGTSYPGWFATNLNLLDITLPDDWARLFAAGSIDRLLAEHVFEHLSEAEARRAFAECHRYLKAGGLFRVAVPDGYRRDPAYVAEVTPPHDGHQVCYTIDTLPPLLEAAGFQVRPLEYFDAEENFHAHPWDERDGFVQRSIRFDHQEDFRREEMFYTSLIVDAKKSKSCAASAD